MEHGTTRFNQDIDTGIKNGQPILYSGTRVINTEYIGNYNYGYIGETLFSKTVLLIGGTGVGIGVGQPEDEKDRQAITQGFDDMLEYY